METTGLFMTSGDIADASALQAALAVSTLDLFQNNVTPTKNSVVGDFVVATYDGYVQQAIATVPPPIIDSINGGISLVIPSNLFVYGPVGSPPVTNQIYGFIIRTAAGKLLAAGTFANPISMAALMDAIPLQVLLNFAP